MNRPYTEVMVEQGTPAWLQARCGMITGSRAADFAKTLAKGGWASSRADYMLEIVTERLTNQIEDPRPPSPAMLRGTELEPLARDAYEDLTGFMVNRAGFFVSTEFDRVGCSVDGVVVDGGEGRLLEIKCPRAAKIVAASRSETFPSEYRYQIAHNLLVTGHEVCDLVLFHPDLPDWLRITRWEVTREMAGVESYRETLLGFIRDVDQMEDEVRRGKKS